MHVCVICVVSDAHKAHRTHSSKDSDDEDYSVDNVKMLKYEAKGSYAQRHDQQRFPGADYFMENPIYGMYEDEEGGFYFHSPRD